MTLLSETCALGKLLLDMPATNSETNAAIANLLMLCSTARDYRQWYCLFTNSLYHDMVKANRFYGQIFYKRYPKRRWWSRRKLQHCEQFILYLFSTILGLHWTSQRVTVLPSHLVSFSFLFCFSEIAAFAISLWCKSKLEFVTCQVISVLILYRSL